METVMNNVYSINHRPSGTIEPTQDRIKFVEYMAALADDYLAGKIDIITIGHVDEDGVPNVEFGTFPVNFGNDVLALGVESHRQASQVCAEAREIIKTGA